MSGITLLHGLAGRIRQARSRRRRAKIKARMVRLGHLRTNQPTTTKDTT